MVSDFDQEVGGLLQFLGVDWDDAVRDYAKTAQAAGKILTPSYQQVTEPIYERARYRWERYADQLEDIRGRLGPLAESFGYET